MYAALIVTIISLTTYIIERRQQQGLTSKLIPNILTDSSFFIYAAHTLPQGIILWSLKLEWLPITGATSALIVYFLSPVILTTVCLLSFILLRRISPISLYFLTGGRQKNSEKAINKSFKSPNLVLIIVAVTLYI